MIPSFLGALERLMLVRDGVHSFDSGRSRNASMILALDQGTPLAQVARAAGCSRTTVYYWLRIYQKHRDPEALSCGVSRESGRTPSRVAAALNAMTPARNRRHRARRLFDPAARRTLRLDAHAAPDPRVRLSSAIVWAIERGVSPTLVAHASGLARQSVYRLRRRVRAGQGGMRAARSRPERTQPRDDR